jgi:signal transduction histidine kinase
MADERAAVGELGRIASSAPDVSDIYEIFASRVGSLVPFSMLSVNLIDQNDHTFTTRYVAGDRISHHLSGSKMPLAGKLGYGVAHDFNNLLSAKLGFAQLADNQLVLDQRVNGNYIKQITTAAERSAGLVRQLLAFSRRQITAQLCCQLTSRRKPG